jgi:hypothetical protein
MGLPISNSERFFIGTDTEVDVSKGQTLSTMLGARPLIE